MFTLTLKSGKYRLTEKWALKYLASFNIPAIRLLGSAPIKLDNDSYIIKG